MTGDEGKAERAGRDRASEEADAEAKDGPDPEEPDLLLLQIATWTPYGYRFRSPYCTSSGWIERDGSDAPGLSSQEDEARPDRNSQSEATGEKASGRAQADKEDSIKTVFEKQEIEP